MSAPALELTPCASARHFFGAELRHRRTAAGLSISRLAALVFISPQMLSKVEVAQRFPTRDLAERCDAVLNANGALARLHCLVEAEREAEESAPKDPAADDRALLMRLLETVAGTSRSDPGIGLRAHAVLQRIDGTLRTAEQCVASAHRHIGRAQSRKSRHESIAAQ